MEKAKIKSTELDSADVITASTPSEPVYNLNVTGNNKTLGDLRFSVYENNVFKEGGLLDYNNVQTLLKKYFEEGIDKDYPLKTTVTKDSKDTTFEDMISYDRIIMATSTEGFDGYYEWKPFGGTGGTGIFKWLSEAKSDPQE